MLNPQKIESLVLTLHDGLIDGESSEIVLSSLDEMWEAMDDTVRRKYVGLLHDLKSLRGSDVALEGHNPNEDDAVAESQSFATQGEWEKSLESLRGFVPSHTKTEVAKLRARAWKELGFPKVADLFENAE